MNRIPTEGLKHSSVSGEDEIITRLNEQNPDRGIETPAPAEIPPVDPFGLNEQNPDRGIETVLIGALIPS